jgi:hypothetical protein
MTDRIARTVVHFAAHDPNEHVGGVSAFAKNLRLVFENVVMMTPERHDFGKVAEERWPVICDNHWVLSVPLPIPVIGFQHGVAAVKWRATHSLSDFGLSRRQKRAARRPNTLWVACAAWISDTFAQRHGNRATCVIYHQVDLNRFDGTLDNAGSRLILHDARTRSKGARQITWLQAAFPHFDFEPLACAPEQVPDRMRRAASFVHLSRYEGNSIVCNEALAQNLPCLLTRVGLMLDSERPTDVFLIDAERAFADRTYLLDRAGEFLNTLGTRHYNPRFWIERHASLGVATRAWRQVLAEFDALPWS